MVILGLSFDFHDAAAALIVDGAIVFAAEEERYSRVKHDRRLPRLAVQAALRHARIGIDAIDAVVFYEQPMVKFGRIHAACLNAPDGEGLLRENLAYWFRHGKFQVAERIAEVLGVPLKKVHFAAHHNSHAASAYFASGFDPACVVTLDGIGEYETASISVGRGTTLRRIDELRYPNSLGLFYSAMTAFLGFEVNEGEYKVMGMAGFGTPNWQDSLRPLLFAPDGGIRVDLNFFDFGMAVKRPYRQALLDLLGPAREPESDFDPMASGDLGATSRHYADVAASVQRVAEDAVLHFLREAVRRTGIRQVAYAGGVALNSLANGRAQRELGIDLYVHPSPGDAGGALGAALYHHCVDLELPRPSPVSDPLLGSAYDQQEVAAALSQAAIRKSETFPDQQSMLDRAAQLLAEGKVLGWFQGRFEWGPRALGARSILADPSFPDMKRIINEKIKFRELFRPFAPAVLAEHAQRYFDVPADLGTLAPERFMLSVCRVRADQADAIPAVTHVDGTARVQIVGPETGSPFRRLLERFHALKGLPVLLNTSFNRRGEPMVAAPRDALQTFFYSGLDALVMENTIVWK